MTAPVNISALLTDSSLQHMEDFDVHASLHQDAEAD
jgi:hypothetical protein